MDGRPITIRETVNAAKDKIGAKDLKGVLKDATKLVVAKGKKVVTIDLPKDKPTAAEIAQGHAGAYGQSPRAQCALGQKGLGGFFPPRSTKSSWADLSGASA